MPTSEIKPTSSAKDDIQKAEEPNKVTSTAHCFQGEGFKLAETTRLEAFSDGAFAITITLLVIEIHRPNAAPGELANELLKEWPSYLAYAIAFLYVGVIWLNHHYWTSPVNAYS